MLFRECKSFGLVRPNRRYSSVIDASFQSTATGRNANCWRKFNETKDENQITTTTPSSYCDDNIF